jgi:predicted transcriptional regulator
MKEPSNFTNRELALLIEGVKEHHRESFNELVKKLDRVLEQTTKTNGRLGVIEIWKANIEGRLWILPIITSAVVAGIIKIIL